MVGYINMENLISIRNLFSKPGMNLWNLFKIPLLLNQHRIILYKFVVSYWGASDSPLERPNLNQVRPNIYIKWLQWGFWLFCYIWGQALLILLLWLKITWAKIRLVYPETVAMRHSSCARCMFKLTEYSLSLLGATKNSLQHLRHYKYKNNCRGGKACRNRLNMHFPFLERVQCFSIWLRRDGEMTMERENKVFRPPA